MSKQQSAVLSAPGSVVESFMARTYTRLESPRARRRPRVADGVIPWTKDQPMSPWRSTSAWGRRRLVDHLTDYYGITIKRAVEMMAKCFRVQHDDGSAWVARVFSPVRPREVITGELEWKEAITGRVVEGDATQLAAS